MEKVGIAMCNPDPNFWFGRSVFVTGHTGFKGGWIALWLTKLGAKVYGYSLSPPTEKSFFGETQLQKKLTHSVFGDVRDLDKICKAMQEAKPSIVLHMAAQSLVRKSYDFPVETFTTNLIGTVNLFEAARATDTVEAIVNITTDKCYENQEWDWSYRENDRLGGCDPYSSSKACSELATIAYRESFLKKAGVQIASARAGNVIGGGDWAKDRLIPDFLKAYDDGEVLHIRSPQSIRPWQHVLDPLCGYLLLSEKLVNRGSEFSQAWNFGPDETGSKPVSWVIEYLGTKLSNSRWKHENILQPHEAGLLKLDSSKAKKKLNWRPRWTLDTALNQTVSWHQSWKKNGSMEEVSIKQIEAYEAA